MTTIQTASERLPLRVVIASGAAGVAVLGGYAVLSWWIATGFAVPNRPVTQWLGFWQLAAVAMQAALLVRLSAGLAGRAAFPAWCLRWFAGCAVAMWLLAFGQLAIRLAVQ